jgi:general nucleoside transport system ATP-binding protein
VLTSAGTLSGGNQQKVVVARELSRPNKLLLASQPTRGLDVGSIEFVHSQIVKERDRGVAVIIVSSELDEIYALSDRIAVMYEGKIVGMRAPDVSEQELGLLMTGAGSDGQPGSGEGPHSPDADEILEMPGTLADQPAPRPEEPTQ